MRVNEPAVRVARAMEGGSRVARRVSVARGTLLGIGGQAWQIATAFILYKFLAHQLGVAGFGTWRLVLSVLMYFELFVNSGLVKVVTKRIADSPRDAPALERSAYLGQGALAFALFAIALILAGPIAAGMRDPSLAFLIRIAALDIPLVGAFTVATAILLGVHRFERQALGTTIYATAKFVAIGLLVWKGFSVPGALLGNAFASVVGFAVVFSPWGISDVTLRKAARDAGSMAAYSMPFLAQTMLEGVWSYVDLWFVGSMVSPATAVGLYGAAVAIRELPGMLFAGLHRTIFPSVSASHAENDERLVARYTTQAMRLTVMATVFGAALAASTGAQALTFVFSPLFAAGALPLAILMAGECGQNVRATGGEVLMAQGRRRTVLAVMTVGAALEIAMLALLTPRYGLVGAASAAAITAVAAGGAFVYVLRALVGWRIARTLVGSLAAAVVVGVLLAWWHPAVLWLPVAYVLAAVVYAGVLLAVREVGKDDVASVRAAMGR
jgi:stage V sporulation protein B